MEHIITLAFNIDDDAVQKRLNESAYKEICDKLYGELKENVESCLPERLTGRYYDHRSEVDWYEIVKRSVSSIIEQHTEQIISMAIDRMAENLMRVGATKDVRGISKNVARALTGDCFATTGDEAQVGVGATVVPSFGDFCGQEFEVTHIFEDFEGKVLVAAGPALGPEEMFFEQYPFVTADGQPVKFNGTYYNEQGKKTGVVKGLRLDPQGPVAVVHKRGSYTDIPCKLMYAEVTDFRA